MLGQATSNTPAGTARDDDSITAAGIPWYRRATYDRVLEVMTDSERLPETYDAWLARAERAIEQARNVGLQTLKAHLDPDQFLVWCDEHDLEPNNFARLAFVERVLTAEGPVGHA
ncbi:MAG: hypothetical protein EOP08_09760 [Proteobacteria bacterium]|nr:MAG: hypothetical protein EOP08_09760 [Pseudomonadota bacterium]